MRLYLDASPIIYSVEAVQPYAPVVDARRDVMDRATQIRAQYGFKTPDAIHLGAAVASGCDVFLTNDHRLDRFAGITIEVIQP